MGFNWELMKRIAAGGAAKVKGAFSASLPRIDENLPLDLRFTALVQIPEANFLLGGDALKMVYPKGYGDVKAYGKISWGDSVAHRFYLKFEAEPLYILQVVVGKKGEIEECRLYMPYDEVMPTSGEGTSSDCWPFWLNEHDGLIGWSVFDLPDGGPRYFRTWEDTGTEVVVSREKTDEGENVITRIPPINFTEILYLDENGKSSVDIEYTGMLYGRWIEEDILAEYLLLCAVEDSEGAAVRVMVGMDFDPATLKIL